MRRSDAVQIAEALRGLCTGDQDPPRPWAHMSHVGQVTEVTRVRGGRDASRFTLAVDEQRYIVAVVRMDDL